MGVQGRGRWVAGVALAVLVAGCSGAPVAGTPGPAPPGVAVAEDAVVGPPKDEVGTVCAAVVIGNLVLLQDTIESAEGDDGTRTSIDQQFADFRAGLLQYAQGLRTEAGKVTDPQLRALVERVAAGAAAAADPAAGEAETREWEQANDELLALCEG